MLVAGLAACATGAATFSGGFATGSTAAATISAGAGGEKACSSGEADGGENTCDLDHGCVGRRNQDYLTNESEVKARKTVQPSFLENLSSEEFRLAKKLIDPREQSTGTTAIEDAMVEGEGDFRFGDWDEGFDFGAPNGLLPAYAKAED